MRIVKACRALTPFHKLLYEEHYGLHNDARGAWISARDVGHRLGVSRATVERGRDDLKRWGLFTKSCDGSGRTDHWFCVFPIDHPRVHRITDDELDRYAELLEEHITSLGDDGGLHPTDENERHLPHSREEV